MPWRLVDQPHRKLTDFKLQRFSLPLSHFFSPSFPPSAASVPTINPRANARRTFFSVIYRGPIERRASNAIGRTLVAGWTLAIVLGLPRGTSGSNRGQTPPVVSSATEIAVVKRRELSTVNYSLRGGRVPLQPAAIRRDRAHGQS